MSEEIKVNEIPVVETVNQVTKKETPNEPFKFFKNCSATLKRLSFAIFAVNLFIIVIVAILGVVIGGMYIGWDIISILAVPIITVVAILVILARLFSALVYGFAEIVEKHEN